MSMFYEEINFFKQSFDNQIRSMIEQIKILEKLYNDSIHKKNKI